MGASRFRSEFGIRIRTLLLPSFFKRTLKDGEFFLKGHLVFQGAPRCSKMLHPSFDLGFALRGFCSTLVLLYPGFALPRFCSTRVLPYPGFALPEFCSTWVLLYPGFALPGFCSTRILLYPGFDSGFDPGCRWPPLSTVGCRWAPLCAAGCHWEPLGTFVLILQLVAGNH